MATFTTIPDTDVDANSPITENLMKALRDNPLAIQQGDSSAPNIVNAALDDISISILEDYVAGSYVVANSSSEESTQNTSYTIKKSIYVPREGTITTYFQLKAESNVSYGKVYINGSPVGTERSTTSTSYVAYTENFSVSAGDIVQLYIKTSVSGSLTEAWCANFQVRVSNPIAPYVTS